jgi:hypothetical protein
MIRSLRRDDASANLGVKIPSGGTLGCADWVCSGKSGVVMMLASKHQFMPDCSYVSARCS